MREYIEHVSALHKAETHSQWCEYVLHKVTERRHTRCAALSDEMDRLVASGLAVLDPETGDYSAR